MSNQISDHIYLHRISSRKVKFVEIEIYSKQWRSQGYMFGGSTTYIYGGGAQINCTKKVPDGEAEVD